MSSLSQVTSAVLHRSILGPVQFNLLINDLNDGIDCALEKWLIDQDSCAAIQRDRDKMEK